MASGKKGLIERARVQAREMLRELAAEGKA
jgi:hypothetical protein